MDVLRVTFDDGQVSELPARAVGIVAAERKWKGDLPRIEGTLYACWYCSPARATVTFDAWLETVADFEPVTPKEAPSGPPTEPSPEG